MVTALGARALCCVVVTCGAGFTSIIRVPRTISGGFRLWGTRQHVPVPARHPTRHPARHPGFLGVETGVQIRLLLLHVSTP